MNKSSIVKKTIILALILVAVALMIFLIDNYLLKSSLTVNVSMAKNFDNATIQIKELNTNKKVIEKGISGSGTSTFRLNPDNYTVMVTEDDGETVGFTNLQRFKSSDISLELSPEKNVNKLARGSLGCDRVIKNTVYSYSCTTRSAVFKHNRSPDRFLDPAPLNKGLNHEFNIQPYLDGVLAVFEDNETQYVDYLNLKTNSKQRASVPSENPEEYIIITDAINSDPKFLLCNTKEQYCYIYKNISDSNPRRMTLPETDDTQLEFANHFYSLHKNKFLYYTGRPDYASDDPEELKAYRKGIKNNLYITDISGDLSFNKTNLPDSFKANKAILIQDDKMLVQRVSTVELYDIKDELKLVFGVNNPDDIEATADGFIFHIGGSIFGYSLANNTATRLFSSSHLTISRIFSNASGIHFNGFVSNSIDKTLHSYTVTNQNLTGIRWEDFLPYTADKNNLPINKMDYSSSYIKIQPQLTSFGTDRATGEIFYEESEIKKVRQRVLNRLKLDGIDVNSISVIMTLK